MWVFDGEEWTRDGGSSDKEVSTVKIPGPEEMLPRQILEITPTPRARETEVYIPMAIPSVGINKKPR